MNRKITCFGSTKEGKKCGKYPIRGEIYCDMHKKQSNLDSDILKLVDKFVYRVLWVSEEYNTKDLLEKYFEDLGDFVEFNKKNNNIS